MIAGLTYNFLPFMILPIYASLERIDLSLIEAAKDLYASARQAFVRVTLPMTAPGIVAGVLLTFIPASATTSTPSSAAPTSHDRQPDPGELYLNDRNYPEAAALSFLMMAAIVIVVLIYIRVAGTEALMGEEEEVQMSAWWLRRNALMIYAGLAVAYMLIPIACHRRVLVRGDGQGQAQLLARRRLHARVLGARLRRSRS